MLAIETFMNETHVRTNLQPSCYPHFNYGRFYKLALTDCEIIFWGQFVCEWRSMTRAIRLSGQENWTQKEFTRWQNVKRLTKNFTVVIYWTALNMSLVSNPHDFGVQSAWLWKSINMSLPEVRCASNIKGILIFICRYHLLWWTTKHRAFPSITMTCPMEQDADRSETLSEIRLQTSGRWTHIKWSYNDEDEASDKVTM